MAPQSSAAFFNTAINSIFGESVVDIAVEPAFARLGGCNYGMAACTRVFAGVLVRRTIATKCYSALLADAEMHPRCANLDAFFALLTLRMLDYANRGEV